MKKLPKKLIIVLVLLSVIVLLILTGILKLNFSVTNSKTGKKVSLGNDAQSSAKQTAVAPRKLLAERALTFGGASGKPTFSVNIPTGWSKGDETRVDLLVGSPDAEKLSNGQNFTPNVNFIIAKHEIPAKSINDYQGTWKKIMEQSYPSLKFSKDTLTKVGDFDAYMLEGVQTRPEGDEIHQVQYVLWVDDTWVLAIVGSAPQPTWSTYEPLISASVKTLKVNTTAQ